MTSPELIVLRTFTNHIEADLARSALDAVGIESMVRADDGGGMETGLWRSNGVQILVRSTDAKWAEEILSGSASGT
jgi:hypothetical protein